MASNLIRKRVDEAILLNSMNLNEAAFIICLVAISGASKVAFPGKENDKTKFITYLEDRLARTFVSYRGPDETNMKFMLIGDVSFSKLFYEQFRCKLLHEGEAPETLFLNKKSSISMSGKDPLTLEGDWVGLLCRAVINDPKLRQQFADIRDPDPPAPHKLKYMGEGWSISIKRLCRNDTA